MGVDAGGGRVLQSPGTVLSNEFGAIPQRSPSQLMTDLVRDGECGRHVASLCRLLQNMLELGLKGPAAGTGLILEQFQGSVAEVANQDIGHAGLQRIHSKAVGMIAS